MRPQTNATSSCSATTISRNSSTVRDADLPSSTSRLQGHQDSVVSCDFHPDGEVLLSASNDKHIRIWSAFENRRTMMALEGHCDGVMEARFSSDGEQIFSCAKDGALGVWDTFTGVRLRKLVGHHSRVNSVSNTRLGLQTLCSGSEDGTVRLWDERTRNPFRIISTGFAVKSTAFDMSGRQVLYAGVDGQFTIWDIRKNEDVDKLKGHSDTITGLSLAPQGLYMLSYSRDNTLKIWDLEERRLGDECKRTLQIENANENSLLRCAWSRDNKKFAAGSSDGHIYVWDVSTLRLLFKLRMPKGIANDVDFHPAHGVIAAAGSDRTLYMIETNNLNTNSNEN